MIKDFQRAITEQDWAMVIHCWEILSGETYKPLEVIKAAPKKTRITRDKAVDFEKAPIKKKRKSRAAAATMNRVVTKRNKFEEMIPTLKVVKDAGYDKVNDDVPLTPRTRQPFIPKTVTCDCGATETVAPLFARPNWKCDKCASGRRKSN
jgi:hypothetical protein